MSKEIYSETDSILLKNQHKTQYESINTKAGLRLDSENKMLGFNGIDEFAMIANTADINTGPSYPNRTISVWFKCNDVSKAGKQVIYEEGGGVKGFNIYIFNGSVYLGSWTNSWGHWFSSSGISSNKWHHACLVLESASDLKAYIDGHEIGIVNGATAISAHSGDISIARNGKTKFHDNNGNAGPNSYFEGFLDELRIWNEARSVEQIRSEMHKQLDDPDLETNLVCNLRFNQIENDEIEDYSAFGNNGNLSMGSVDNWLLTTAPMPYYSVDNGNWMNSSVWAGGQMPPQNSWARVEIGHALTINSGLVEVTDLVIKSAGTLTIAENNSLTVLNNLQNEAGESGLVLKSGPAGASSLIHNSDNVDGKVESYFDLNAHYFISAPINNAYSNVFMDQYMFEWNETTYSWDNFSETNVWLQSCKGYDIYNVTNQTITYSGTLHNAEQEIPGLTYTATGNGDPGFNLVGNPYPSVLDVNQINFPMETFFWWDVYTIVPAVHVLRHDTKTYYLWSSGSNSGDLEARYIQPGQGFFVEVSSWGAWFGNQNLSFSNAARTHQGLGSIDKNQSGEYNMETLKISIKNSSGYTDASYLVFRDSATHYFDSSFDVTKLTGDMSYPYIYSYFPEDTVDRKLGINAFNLSEKNSIVPLGLYLPEDGEYRLEVSQMDKFDDDQEFYLHDKLLDKTYDLREQSSISFSFVNGQAVNRFDISFGNVNKVNNESKNEEILVYFSKGKLYTLSNTSDNNRGTIEIYNLLGQLEKQATLREIETGLTLDLPTAYYLCKINTNKGSSVQKIYIP